MLTEIRLEECELDCAMIGKRVRNARKAKKVTQEELSEHCGCTPPTSVILKMVRDGAMWHCPVPVVLSKRHKARRTERNK